jgi:hypothetical protein
MGSGAVIQVPSFIKIGSGIQKLMGDTQTSTWPHKPTLFFQYKESRLKMGGIIVWRRHDTFGNHSFIFPAALSCSFSAD